MTPDDAAFAALARQIAQTSGFALEAYKDKCIRRRIAVRMRACGVHSYEDYRMLLDRSPNEYERLRDALTINVTRFYRNAETWSLLRRDVLPALLDRRRGEVRAWSAGCSSGEEAYTLALLAAEHLDRVGRGDELARLTIDATDIDRTSLDRARAACYRSEGLTEMPDELARPYFEPAGHERRVIDRVRRRVQVRALDLSREAPLRTDYDLILCRNVVIYFDRVMQERLFQTFADALVPGGYLVLGKVETLFGAARERLVLIDPRERVYRRPA
ncbi:MAG TPA: protein-glutamate O-methyltransferase CheR [Gemmatimonadales bacterium]|nr:protein-glutamate O-methyltransferase CheR [Gemmatimonadales bacterium]